MWPFTKRVSLNIQTVQRDPFKLRLTEWQSDQNMTNAAGKLLLDSTFQLMLQVNRNESPALMHLNMDAPLEIRALHQARIEGYNMALANFEAMSVHKPLPAELVATFEEEEREV